MSIDLLLAAAQHLEQQSKRKRDEDGRDDVTLDSPSGRQQSAGAATPHVPAGRPARSPSSFIATHHSYVRSPPVPTPTPPTPPPPPPPAASPGVSTAESPRNGAVGAAAAPPTYRYDVADDLQERKARVSAGTREVHNKLEKNRRAHLKECFETLRRQVPVLDDKRTSNLGILRGALRYIGTLKRKERECEHEMERLAREKIANQQRLAQLKRDLSAKWDHLDFSALLPDVAAANDDSNSTLSASERFDGDSYQASPEPRDAGVGSPEPRRRVAERPAAASPAYLAGHSSGYSSSSPTVAAVEQRHPAGLAGLAAMASSQEKLLVTGHKVSVVQAGTSGEQQQQPQQTQQQQKGLLRTEHGVYVPVTGLSDVGRAATVSYVEHPLNTSRKALVLETVPTHIVPAQLMHSGNTVRLTGTAGLQLAPPALQVLTPAGVRLISASGTVHTSGALTTSVSSGPRTVLSLQSRAGVTPQRAVQPDAVSQRAALHRDGGQQRPPAHSDATVGVSGLTQLVTSPLPRLVTQPVTHLVAPVSAATVTVLGQPKVVNQLPIMTSYMGSSGSQSSLGKAVVVVTASGLVPVSKH